MNRWGRQVACGVLAMLLVLLAPRVEAQPVHRLTQGDMAFGNDAEPPREGWRPFRLPDVFLQGSGIPRDRIGWYRFRFELAEVPAEPLVLLVQRVVTTAEFRVNGSLMNAGVRFDGQHGHGRTVMMNWPHWMPLPAGVLRPGTNEVLVRLAADDVVVPAVVGLAVGPAQALHGEYLLRDVVQRRIPQAMVVLMLAWLPVGLVLWWRERQPLQRQLLLTLAAWLFGLMLYLTPDNGLSRLEESAVSVLAWVGFHWLLLLLLWQLAGRLWRWYPMAVHLGSALPLACGLAVLLLAPHVEWLAALMLPSLGLRLLAMAMLAQWARRERSIAAFLLAGVMLLWIAGDLQLMLVAIDLLPPDPFMLTPAIGLLLLLVLLAMGAGQVVRQRELAAEQRLMAVLAERQRLMLDMHDGLGAQLATAVRLARSEQIPRADVAGAVEDALNDLRLVIDSLDPGLHALPELLGQLRERTEPRLRALGQRQEWRIEPLPSHPPLAPGAALDVLRIAQEALNNAARHGGPGALLRVQLRPAEGGCELRISDDGPGIGALPSGSGRGLSSMQRRARRLAGRLDIRPADGGGTLVCLWLPAAGARP